jgi:osmotically-inducible protein OsmY
MGPQDYQRSDERIREEVCERLTRHGQVDARQIAVTVENGEVVLSGSVHSRAMKRMAEDVVDDVAGVQDVQNLLKIESREG